MEDKLLVHQDLGAVRLISLNRLSVANALNQELYESLVQSLCEAQNQDKVRAVVLTSASKSIFCAGADIKEFKSENLAHAKQLRRDLLLRTLEAFLSFSKPFATCVHGKAIGAGVMLPLATDRIFASDTAQFSFPEMALGMPSPLGIELLLSRLKRSFVFDLIQGGEIIGTQRALEINLIDASYGDEDLQNKAIEWAQKIPSNFAFECNKKWMNQKLFERVKLSLLASANFDQT